MAGPENLSAMNVASATNTQQFSDYSSSFNSHIYSLVPNGSRCLDVGCSTGNLGAELISKKNCQVDGIESNPVAAATAKQRGYGNLHNINLDFQLSALESLDVKYDVIVCADVLEHLVNPDLTLKSLKKNLKPNGIFIISLPNVAFALNRLRLLLGRWDYTEYGILDRTHLRFYTIDSGARMVQSAQLKVLEVKPYNQFGILRYLKPLDSWFPGLLAFQFIVVAQKEQE